MASSPANNKPSLSSSPSFLCRQNPKFRNSETTGDPMRRSFQANPFPADLSRRRNSIGGGDKENHNDNDQQFPNVLKAPKGGSKNFMSPTISAVSKIKSSPRKKKILSDKNQVFTRSFDNRTNHHQQVRSSVSFSDVVSIIGEEDKEHNHICIDEKKQLDDDDVTVTDFEENHGDFDDSSFFNFSHLPPPSVPYASSPVFVTQEVDPSLEPYDPKRNYLSPRPQFLHYKPNPRIEHRSDECKQLEELFISESFSDLSAEESQQEEEVASQEGVLTVEEEAKVIQDEEAESDEEEEEVVVGESTEEEETHQISKQSRFKLLSWILALGVAYLLLVSSVIFTQPNISQDSPFYKFHISQEFTKSVARKSFEQLSEKLGMLAGSSLVYLDKLISSLREEARYGPFKFHNLTDILEDTRLFDTVFQTTSGDSQNWRLEMDIEEENVGHQEAEEAENGEELGLEAVYEEDGNEFEQTEIRMATDTELSGGEGYSESFSEEESVGQETDGVEGNREYAENNQKNLEEVHESETVSAKDDEKNMEEAESDKQQLDNVESATISSQQQEETVPEEEGIGETNIIDMSTETSDVDGNGLEEDSEIGEVVNAAGSGILLSNQKKVLALVSTVMVLLASAAAFFLLPKKKAKPVMMAPEDEKPTTMSVTKKVESEQAPAENLNKESLSSLNFHEEVEDDRETEVSSFLSEVSFSFHKNKTLNICNNNNNKDDLKEYQSRVGGGKSNDRSESTASSASEYSIGSVSYGSFTTYEKIQKKSGRKEEEIVTPVRRSSRIRNHQHSGQ